MKSALPLKGSAMLTIWPHKSTKCNIPGVIYAISYLANIHEETFTYASDIRDKQFQSENLISMHLIFQSGEYSQNIKMNK